MRRVLLSALALFSSALPQACGDAADERCQSCSDGNGDGPGPGHQGDGGDGTPSDGSTCESCPSDGTSDGTDGAADGLADGSSDGSGDWGDGSADGANDGGDDNTDGTADGDDGGDDEPGPIRGMLPNGVDPTKPETIPDDPNPGQDTEAEALLRMAVRFYGAQRCGDGANYLLYDDPHGNECHMQDGEDYGGRDMTGGWHDAGDFIKFSLTSSWASYALLKIFDVYPDAFDDEYGARHEGSPNGVPDVLDQAKYAVDYLVKIHPAEDELIARIGGDQDHGGWFSSPEQSELDYDQGGGARPVNPNGEAGADVAGLASASLALMSRLYRAHDGGLADRYLTHAKQIYAYGKAHLEPTSDNFYESESFQDDMLCGAVELYRATREPQYLSDAVKFDDEVNVHGWAPDWSNPTDFCRHSLAAIGTDDTLGYWKEDAARYLTSVSSRQYVDGLMLVEGCDWGTLACASGAGTSAAFLYDLTGDTSYRDFAQSQAAFIMGDNEYGHSFVVGYGPGAPENPHHRNSLATGHPLEGALVGGPTADDYQDEENPNWFFPRGYDDDSGDFVHNEVAIDYNTGLVGLAAFLVASERRH